MSPLELISQCQALIRLCSEFNHERNEDGKCVLVPGRSPLPDDTTCQPDTDSWFERTAYRRIPHSSCEGGVRLDRGKEHLCPGLKGHGFFFWLFVLMLPFAFVALGVTWWYRRSGMATGYISSFLRSVSIANLDTRIPELFVFLAEATHVGAVSARMPVWSTTLRPYRGTSWAWWVSHGRRWRIRSMGGRRGSGIGLDTAIGMYRSMRMRRSCDSRMRRSRTVLIVWTVTLVDRLGFDVLMLLVQKDR